MTIGQARRSSLIDVSDLGSKSRKSKVSSNLEHGEEQASEPGSPMFHNAIRFSNQVELNSLQRERRGGIRRAATEPELAKEVEFEDVKEEAQEIERRDGLAQPKSAIVAANIDSEYKKHA